jgi:DNA polymerase-1
MDTLQLVEKKNVQVFTLKRGMNDTVLYDEDAVVERFGFAPLQIIDYKGLRGDSSDNIPGIKGIGEKAATKAIQAFGSLESIYKALSSKDEETLLTTGLTKRMITLLKEGKEEAEFSKVLATIRRDAPIDFSLPENTWGDSVDIDMALDFFQKYELRTLGPRLRTILGIDQPTPQEEESDISEDVIHETAIALWLLDSEQKEASYDNILSYARKETFKEAQEYIYKELRSRPRSLQLYDLIEKPLMSIIESMQDNGIAIHLDFFDNLSKTYRVQLQEIENEIKIVSGQECNIRSPKQLSELLFDTLGLPTKGIKKSSKTGIYTTKAEALEKIKDEHEVVQKILDFRELDKLLSTYIDVIPELVGDDGRLHPTFVQNGTTTGRFSSKDPNVQNIPTRSDLGRKIREGFVAEPNHQLISFDYSQIELRCLAMLSGDQKLSEIFQQQKDIHTSVASLIGDVPEDKVTREMRRKAKIVNFGILYGMGVNSLRKQMGGDRKEAQEFYDGFFNQFPKATSYLDATIEYARKHGYTETIFGRRRAFSNINAKLPFIRAMAERMALNAPIQGTSADIIKLAMVHIESYLQETKKLSSHVRLILQVHDEIIFEVHNDVHDEFKKKAQELMEQVLDNSYLEIETNIPLVVHTSSGKNWSELK